MSGVGKSIFFGMISLVVILFYLSERERVHTQRYLKAPLINDRLENYKQAEMKEKGVTFEYVHTINLDLVDPNDDEICRDLCVVFYTLNGSDPRRWGIGKTYHDSEWIHIDTSVYRGIKKPVVVKAVIGKLSFFETIIWSRVTKREWFHLKRTYKPRVGGGFTRFPIVVGGPKILGEDFLVRVWPLRMTDVVKCVLSTHLKSAELTEKIHFWRFEEFGRFQIFNASQAHFIGQTHVDLRFHISELEWHSIYFIKCATSTLSHRQTGIHFKNVSSHLVGIVPKHVQMEFVDKSPASEPNRHEIGYIVSHHSL